MGSTYRPDGAFVFPGTETINRAEVFSGPGYRAPRPRRSVWGSLSVVVSAVGLIAFFILPLGVLFGILGLRETADGTVAGHAASRAGLTLGLMGSLLWALFWLANALAGA